MPKQLTNRELAKWLAKGKGQVSINGGRDISITYIYEMGHDSDEVPHFIQVRKWDDAEWHEANSDYCEVT